MSIDMQKLAADLVGANRVVPVRADDLAQISLDAERYRWLRDHPAFETEAFLGGLVPAQYDAAVDNAMEAERMSAGFCAALELTNKAIEP